MSPAQTVFGAAPLLDTLRDDLKAARANCLPARATAKGASYTLSLWQKLTCLLDHPELELSTNLAENSMRSIALGRKNWIHFGHKDAGPRIAAILSVIESCRRLNLNPLGGHPKPAIEGQLKTGHRATA